jgi:putative ABC transport system permease protein
VLWARAPFVLRRHPAILASVAVVAALAALVSTGSPFVRAAVRSESLRGQVRQLSPLAAGLEIRSGGRFATDGARRAAAARFAREVAKTGSPVLTSVVDVQLAGPSNDGIDVVAMARSGVLSHVHRVAFAAGDGIWISSETAKLSGLRPGAQAQLRGAFAGSSDVRKIELRVAGVYRDLGESLGDPYWANFVQEIRSENPDSPPPPAFVLMDEPTLVRVARRLSPSVENRLEFPVDPSSLTYSSAERLRRRFDSISRAVAGVPHDPRVRALGCGVTGVRCTTSSALSSTLVVAARNVAAVEPTISLLSTIGLVVALGLSIAAGVFLVRRRTDEARLSLTRGEPPLLFAARSGVEVLVPVAAGAACGFAVALAALAALAVEGVIDRGTIEDGALRAAAAGLAGLCAVTIGVWMAAPRVQRRHATDVLRRVPWELVPLLAVAGAAAVLETGGGLARDQNGYAHPTLSVFILPLLVAAALAGAAIRVVRVLLRRPVDDVAPPLFLAIRRLAAASGLLVAVIVTTAVSFAAFAFAQTASSSLTRSVAAKAYLGNGSDVQGVINPPRGVTAQFPFPVALVQVDSGNFALADGTSVDVIAGGPGILRRTLRWGKGWSGDPRRLLPRLQGKGVPLKVLATPGTPSSDAILDQGARIPIRIVGHTPFPGTTAGRPALVVSAHALAAAAARGHVPYPGPGAQGLLWAKGSPRTLIPRLAASSLYPFYLTTISHIREDGSVVASERSFRYVRAIGEVAGALSLLGLLLYLQARQHGQRIASAFARRMGLGSAGDAGALATEGALAVAVGVAVGIAAALLTATPLIRKIDPLPAYPPSITTVIPWTTLLVSGCVAVCIGALLGALATAIAARSDVAEVLRVA